MSIEHVFISLLINKKINISTNAQVIWYLFQYYCHKNNGVTSFVKTVKEIREDTELSTDAIRRGITELSKNEIIGVFGGSGRKPNTYHMNNSKLRKLHALLSN